MALGKVNTFIEKYNLHNMVKILILLLILFILYRLFMCNINKNKHKNITKLNNTHNNNQLVEGFQALSYV